MSDLINIPIFDYPDSRLSRLFTKVSMSPDNRGSTVLANVMLGGNHAMDQHPIQGGVEILFVPLCYRNWDKFWPDGPLGLYADFTFTIYMYTL